MIPHPSLFVGNAMSRDYVIVEPAARGQQDVVTNSHDNPIAVTTSVIEGPFGTLEEAKQRLEEQYGKQQIVSIPPQNE